MITATQGRKPTTAAKLKNTELDHDSLGQEVKKVLQWLESKANVDNQQGMARYGITANNVFGISMPELRAYQKRLGHDHDLALALWQTGAYEARMLAAFVDIPSQVTKSQMDAWCRDFDNWAICDTVCMHLFDKTPHAWTKLEQWAKKPREFSKRAAFSLLASLSVHDKQAPDAAFLRGLELVEAHANDQRNFVKKAVNWALRGIGKRNQMLHRAALKTARRLVRTHDTTSRWIGRDALRELESPGVLKRIAKRP